MSIANDWHGDEFRKTVAWDITLTPREVEVIVAPIPTEMLEAEVARRRAPDEWVYGAIARALALTQGYPKWMDVTRWPATIPTPTWNPDAEAWEV